MAAVRSSCDSRHQSGSHAVQSCTSVSAVQLAGLAWTQTCLPGRCSYCYCWLHRQLLLPWEAAGVFAPEHKRREPIFARPRRSILPCVQGSAQWCVCPFSACGRVGAVGWRGKAYLLRAVCRAHCVVNAVCRARAHTLHKKNPGTFIRLGRSESQQPATEVRTQRMVGRSVAIVLHVHDAWAGGMPGSGLAAAAAAGRYKRTDGRSDRPAHGRGR